MAELGGIGYADLEFAGHLVAEFGTEGVECVVSAGGADDDFESARVDVDGEDLKLVGYTGGDSIKEFRGERDMLEVDEFKSGGVEHFAHEAKFQHGRGFVHFVFTANDAKYAKTGQLSTEWGQANGLHGSGDV
ncbi:MAG TPA: hypothetical protein VGH19_07050 [Verrucomicrobiae bacterium]